MLPVIALGFQCCTASNAWMIIEVEYQYAWLALNITKQVFDHRVVSTLFLY